MANSRIGIIGQTDQKEVLAETANQIKATNRPIAGGGLFLFDR
ncbi:MAG: hypothetical protein AAB360_01045 [Patescibacteria group bacterium]